MIRVRYLPIYIQPTWSLDSDVFTWRACNDQSWLNSR